MASSDLDDSFQGQSAPTPRHVTALRARIPATTVVWALTAINVAVFLAMELSGGSTNVRVLDAFGAKVNFRIAQGEYWRLLTSAFLHIGTTHILFNMFALMSFGRLAELIYGHGRFLALYLVSAITGALASYLFTRGLSAGASGAIFGVAGALVMFFLRNRQVPAIGARAQLGGLVMVLVINGVWGAVQPGIDNFAHLGGFLGGAITGASLSPRIVPIYGEDGAQIGLRKQMAPTQAWLVVPAVLAIVAAILESSHGR